MFGLSGLKWRTWTSDGWATDCDQYYKPYSYCSAEKDKEFKQVLMASDILLRTGLVVLGLQI